MGGEASSTPWIGRSFGLALAAWAAVWLLGVLAWTWAGSVPTVLLQAIVAIVGAGWPLSLLVWSAWVLVRRSWQAGVVRLAVLVAAGAALLAMIEPWSWVGVSWHAAAERRAYDAVVAQERQLAGPAGPKLPKVSGRVRYYVWRRRPLIIAFPWIDDPQAGVYGVVYDEQGCPPPPRKPVFEPGPTGAGPPIMNPGSFYRRHFGGHYCWAEMAF